ncbi:MAG: 16S rRNA (cytosine(1402)-N(4))-methyltransferase RsmH [Thermodesulfobacteriota bacterium]|nr:16S rRNA (cytosine(1402)-N(4))-methyltransferase RsmH [Thermodesulfobacteriota bacterium]
MEYYHIPVLIHETVKALITFNDGVYVDGTVGGGGHSKSIGEKLTSGGHLICLDRDSDAVNFSKKRLAFLGDRVTVVKANYTDLKEILQGLGFERVNGIFLDLGVSSYQIEKSGRGFSFNRDELLDMRMSTDSNVTAHQLVNTLSLKDLEKILRDYGEERRARSIVKSIGRERKKGTIDSSLHLGDLICSAIPMRNRPGAKHPATRSFQALRIAVNRELENLKMFLDNVPPLLKKGGRLVILAYHSLEDQLVKQAMVNWEKACMCPPDFPTCVCNQIPLFRRLHKKGIKPDQKEIDFNPRARSAILRSVERI